MLPLSLSEKLLRLAEGEQIAASLLKHAVVRELKDEHIILEKISGRTKATLCIADVPALDKWLYNRYAIPDLAAYIQALKNEATDRAELVRVSSDSKTVTRRTYKGFLVNSYVPVPCALNGQPFVVQPHVGTFQFVYDFERFIPDADVVVIGIENMENFRHVAKLAYLFEGIIPLFVSRYPQEQSKDLIKWLQSIPNSYLHFGDFDFAGISIYLNEYKPHLGERASFFVPDNVEELLSLHGNSKLYDQQRSVSGEIVEENLLVLVGLIHKYKRGLEQEVFLI